MIDAAIESTTQAISDKFYEFIVDIITVVFQWVIGSTSGFWANSSITQVIGFAQWTARVVFIVTLVVVVLDIAEDFTSGKQVYTSIIATNIAKGMGFVEVAPVLARFSIELSDKMVGRFNLSSQMRGLNNIYDMIEDASGGAIALITAIVVLIACIAFLVMVLKRFGMMLVQILTCCLFVPSIMRGDTTAMGSWLRQTIAIAITFFCQYLLFYLGIFFWISRDTLIAFGLWLSMGMVTRLLDKFGLSSGTGGVFGSVTSAAQTIASIAK